MAIPIAMIVIGKLSLVRGGRVGGTPNKFWDGRVLLESLTCDGSCLAAFCNSVQPLTRHHTTGQFSLK